MEQGDVLDDCPIFRVEFAPPDDTGAEVIQEDHDVVVLTQSCGLENDKVEDVLVAVLVPYPTLCALEGKASHVRSSKFRKAAVEGNLASYFLLPERSESPTLAWSLVDFHTVFSIPKRLLEQVAASKGGRLRLIPPYKEHLAQAFARYIMRVGLPTTLRGFERFDPGASGTA